MTSKILHGLRRVVVTVLCLIGATTLFVEVSRHLVAHKAYPPVQMPEGLQLVPSPDGRYRAALLTWAGGGGLDPYCNEVLLVVPTSMDVGEAEYTKRYEVFSAECDAFSDHSASPEIVWRSNELLDVSFSINSTASFSRTVSLKKVDASGTVKLEFFVKE
jgi:hypothetical protein